MTGVIRWEDPPAAARHRADAEFNGAEVAAELRQRPCEWGLVAINPRSVGLASGISSGRWHAFRPSGSFEAVHRTSPEGDRLIYARFIWRRP